MHSHSYIFAENFHVNNLVLKIFHAFNFHGTRVPMKIIYPRTFPDLWYIPLPNVQRSAFTEQACLMSMGAQVVFKWLQKDSRVVNPKILFPTIYCVADFYHVDFKFVFEIFHSNLNL